MAKILVQEEPRGASELIEIAVASGATQVTLPDVPQLRNQGDQVIVIKSIRLITAKVLSNAPTLGTATTSLTDLKKMSLILYSQGWEKGHLIPLLVLNDVCDSDSTAATTIPYRTSSTRLNDWTDVDWNKSKLMFSSGTSASGASACLLEVEYQRFQKSGGQYYPIDK